MSADMLHGRPQRAVVFRDAHKVGAARRLLYRRYTVRKDIRISFLHMLLNRRRGLSYQTFFTDGLPERKQLDQSHKSRMQRSSC
jgi:hypothetical protein